MAKTTSTSRFWTYLSSLASVQTVAITSIVVTILLLEVRQLGLLQPWELRVFDQMMRIRPS
ncbi:hypothetical protein, partial [Allocoleopsis sp.]|uniref:hypothetical protein n=1 Tax=Allocoleopsis sp. TaxID=3088169 RepID=UPI002FD0C4C6